MQRWALVAGLFGVLTLSSGFGFYNLSVYISVLSQARELSVSAVSVAVSLFFLSGGVAGMVVARLLDRFGARRVMFLGALIAGAALAAVGFCRHLWQLYLLFVIFGVGNAAVSIVTSTTLVTRWFMSSSRSVALSIASTGLSVGGILITPYSAHLLARYDLAQAMPMFGLVFVIGIWLITAVLVRDAPRPAASVGALDDEPAWRYGDAIRTRFFRLLTLGYVLCMASQVGGIAHLFNHALNVTDLSVAALCVQALTAASILGRFTGGYIVTRVPIRWFTIGNLLGQAVGIALVASAEAKGQFVAGSALFGATVGNLLMLQPLWLAEAFPGWEYPRIFSLSNAVSVLGVAGGPLLLGVVFDIASYPLAFAMAAALSLGALLFIVAAGAGPERLSGSQSSDAPIEPERIG